MSLLAETINLSKLYGVKPTSNRGQNFLIDEATYKSIVEAAQIKNDETVLEVGPGLGFLTLELSHVAKKVITVELDRKLYAALHNRLQLEKIKNVDTEEGDIMNFALPWAKKVSQIPNRKLVVVANLPYTITSTFLRFFVSGNKMNILPNRFVLMLQKEVAERITAEAGKMSILAISIQLYASARIVHHVSKKLFWPVPKVDSAVLVIERNDQWLKKLRSKNLSDEQLMRLVRIGFSARRKMLKANLAAGFKLGVDKITEHFSLLGLNPSARAQELSLEEWLKLLPYFS